MQISHLMERNQMSQYMIIYHLLNAEKPLTLKALKNMVDLSAATLEKYLIELEEIMISNDRKLQVIIDSTEVYLEMHPDIHLNDIIAYFLKDSIKFQILTYLFNHDHFSIPILASELMVSEATLNRNLALLNKELSEFDIQIRNGRLRGPFHQIVYFFYHLLLLAWPHQKQRKIIDDYHLESYLINFEHINRQSFSNGGNHRLAFWMYVSQNLAVHVERNDADLLELFNDYQEKSFFIKFKRPLLQYHMRLAKDYREGDLILDIVFLMSHRLLSPTINEQILGHGGQIMESVSLVLNDLNHLTQQSKYVKTGLLYESGQTFSRMTFFKGVIASHPFLTIQSKYYAMAEHLLHITVKDKMHINLKELGDLYLLMRERWAVRLEELHDRPLKELTVALRIDTLNLPAKKIMQQLRDSLEIQRQITIEWYRSDLIFDYLISDFPEEADRSEFTYYLKGKPAGYDIRYLRKVFNQLVTKSR
ncbi:helix-turn-helix domain-containing protein [Aerococcaceae bacterium DSM 111020]|nr:helix-turn-helix domain-containing protein [Aerococcaceae bacterium DSM 111020]